jgi:hypothetical protein
MASGALATAAGVSAGVVKGLVDEGALAVAWIEPDASFPQPDLSLRPRPSIPASGPRPTCWPRCWRPAASRRPCWTG